MKRAISFASAVMLICVGLVGCANSGTTSSVTKSSASVSKSSTEKSDVSTNASTNATTTETTNVSTESQSEKLEPVELTVWMMGTLDQVDADRVWEKYNANLQESLPNTKVNIYIPKDYGSEYTLALASKETIDLCWTGWIHNIPDEARKGNILPLNALLAKYGHGIVESLGQQAIDNHTLSDGEIYQIPAYQGLVNPRRGLRIPTSTLDCVRDGWLDEIQAAVFEYFHTNSLEAQKKALDLFEEYLKALKDNNILYAGCAPVGLKDYLLPTQGFASTSSFELGYTIPWTQDRFKTENIFESGTFKQFVGIVSDWYTKGYIPSDIMTASSYYTEDWDGAITGNQLAFAPTDYVTTKEEKEASLSNEHNMDITIIEATDIWCANLGVATGTSIPFVSKNPERAMMLLNEMYINKDLYRLWVYGIKGEHYTEDGNGIITLDPEGSKRYTQWNWTWGTTMLSAQLSTQVAFPYAHCQEFEKTAYNNPIMRFAFDSTPVADEATNCQSVAKAQILPMVRGTCGENWEAAYDTLVSDMKQSGMDDIVAEVQKQLDEFVKENKLTSFNWK